MPSPKIDTAAPRLLNDDGSASMATAFLMTHHGLRRDLARFAAALRGVLAGDRSRVSALQEEWVNYRNTLHGHHEAEDQRMFPYLRDQRPDLAPVIDRLTVEHRRIDPLLVRGDASFADLVAAPEAAAAVVSELSVLLDEHLALEEANVVPVIREAKAFPPPASDEEARLHAEGFAWSSHGVAPEVLARVDALLPASLRDRLAAARAAFAERAQRVWGPTPTGASHSAVPDWLGDQ
jgi:hemerythrin-like domain-containing protein